MANPDLAAGEATPAGRGRRLRLMTTLCVAAMAGIAGCSSSPEVRTDMSTVAASDSTRDVANAFLHRLFAKRDALGAYEGFATEAMVQHDPAIADELAGLRAHLAEGRRNSDRVANIVNMLLVDGDLFAVHRIEYRDAEDPGTAIVDIWRVERGRIVEHWNVKQPVPAAMPHRNGMGCGDAQNYEAARQRKDILARPTCGLPSPDTTRSASLKIFADYTAQVGEGDVAAAMKAWLSHDYRQHSPMIADGIQGALDFLMVEFGSGTAAMPRFGPMRTVAEGDYVLKHRITTYADGKVTANVDVFRMTAGKVSEHWDVIQPIPAVSANANRMW